MSNEQIQTYFSEGAVHVESASHLSANSCGGECIFVGRTRPETHPKHGSLLTLEYECYQEMAIQELQGLAREAIDRFGVRIVKVSHSIGPVAVGEASVVIAIGSGHREEAFLACKWMIDLLKQRVPLWKKEVWADGTSWSEGAQLGHHE